MGRRRVNDIIRDNACMSPAGAAWVEGLDDLIASLEADWSIVVGEAMSGGTVAHVASATRADGAPCILKLVPPPLPGDATFEVECDVLLAAAGRGYADVYEHDYARCAMLQERLGPQMAENARSVDEWIGTLAELLQSIWEIDIAPPSSLISGADKARWLADFVERSWAEQGEMYPRAVIDETLLFAERRANAHDPSSAVLVHGDAHAWNALEDGSGGYKLIDPDAYVAERAADLSVIMREWNGDLLASGDPLAAVQARCARVSGVAGVDPQAVWEWGWLERIATAMYGNNEYFAEEARNAIAVAEACLGAGPL